MTRLAVGLGHLVALGGCLGLALFAWSHRTEFTQIPWTPRLLAVSAVALVLYLGVVANGALVWQRLLAGLGHSLPRRVAAEVFFVSQLGKYLPGNVGQYAGRLALVRRQGVGAGPALASIALETTATGVSGLGVAATGLLTAGVAGRTGGFTGTALAVAGAVAFGLAFLSPLALEALRRRSARAHDSKAPWPSAGTWMRCTLLLAVNFLLLGTIAFLLADTLAPAVDIRWTACVGLFALAWLAGFATPGAPAGVGVREMVLIAGLRPLAGDGPALVLPLAFRLLTTVGDALGGALGWASSRASGPRLGAPFGH